MPLNLQMTLQPFETWVIDFVGTIQPQGKMGAGYIINATEYMTRWVEAQLAKYCMTATTAKFLFEHVLPQLGYPKILMSDRGTHFLNETINALIEEFQLYHQKNTPYHPQAHRTVKAFNKVLETTLTKVCNAHRSDYDLCVLVILWSYRMTCKKLTAHTHFWLVYGVEAIMSMEYIMPSLYMVQKQREKAWHDRHIKLRTFKVNDLVLLYDSMFDKFPGIFRMHWLGSYAIKEVTDGGAMQLVKLNGEPFPGRVNGSWLKPYTGGPTI
eukprot:PITA_23025